MNALYRKWMSRESAFSCCMLRWHIYYFCRLQATGAPSERSPAMNYESMIGHRTIRSHCLPLPWLPTRWTESPFSRTSGLYKLSEWIKEWMNEYDCRHVLLSRYHIIVLRKSAEVSMTTQVFPLDGSAPPSPLAHLAIMSTLSVGRWDGEEEELPLDLICWS